MPKRISALTVILALMLVPAVGRARQRVDSPSSPPRLSAPYRSIDVRPAPVLVPPDTTATDRVDPQRTPQPFDAGGISALPASPDVSGLTPLRGPPSGQISFPSPLVN